MTDIVVEVRKGMVTGLYCDIEDARFVVVDWDLRERSEPDHEVGLEQDHKRLASLPANTGIQYRQAITT